MVFAIHWHEPATGVHVFPILNPPPTSPSHPSGSSQCTSPEHPVSCFEPGLAIYLTYDHIHVSMLFSQIISPLPSLTESKSLFFTSVSLSFSKYCKLFCIIHTFRCWRYSSEQNVSHCICQFYLGKVFFFFLNVSHVDLTFGCMCVCVCVCGNHSIG